jgi:hypothetical protein
MIKLRDGIIFEDPESRIREYCEVEVYRGFDDRHNISDVISKTDIDSANNLYAMIDRYDNTESRRLLSRSERIRAFLTKTPNENIFAISQEEWREVKDNIRDLLEEFLSVSGIGLAKSTKILHLKRPNLFPILDSFVIKFLLNANISDAEKGLQLEIGLQALERTMEIMIEQEAAFTELVNQTKDLPIALTPVRLFDVLCWTAEKWDIRRNLTAPYGTPHKSLLATPKKGKESTRGSSDFRTNEDSASSARSTVAGFIIELSQKAGYGIRGEKPLAIIAALKYLHDYKIIGKGLLELLEEPHSKTIRSIFITLAKQCKKITDPSSSWNVITGKNRELQNAICKFRDGDVNKAFSQLKPEEIERLLTSYIDRL